MRPGRRPAFRTLRFAAVADSSPGAWQDSIRDFEVGRDRTAALGTVGLERLFIPDVAVTTRNGTTVRGMFKERSGGFYRVETAPGEGCTFILEIPPT